jgi:hypothetical protein
MPRNMPARVTTPILVGREATRQELQVVAARREAENGLVVHTLRRHFDKEAARIDADATSTAVTITLEAELRVLREGIALADGSAAASKLVADRLEQLSRINSRNLERRFSS